MEHSWNDQPPVMIKLFDLAGRKAVVTGASRGIGKTVIEALRANGAFCYGLSNEAIESDDPASSIVNVSSINYRLGIAGRAIYSTSKAGILGLTTGLSRELGRQSIRINTVSPGWVFTERQIQEYFEAPDADSHLNTLAERQSLPIKIHPVDVANHILFYLSEVSRTSTGHNCVVDGGWLLE